MTDQKWLPIVGYEGLYEVSDRGNVRALAREKRTHHHGKDIWFTAKPHPLKPRLKQNGYLQVNLYKGGKMRTFSIHRLVMRAFVGPSNKPVNHIDEVKTHNSLSNLEYLTHAQNVRYSQAKAVESFDLETGRTVKRYDAIVDVRADGFDSGAVQNCCAKRARYKSHKGLGWRYADVKTAR